MIFIPSRNTSPSTSTATCATAGAILSPEVGEFIEMIPPMKRLRDDWYLGTADAVFQNSATVAEEKCDYTL